MLARLKLEISSLNRIWKYLSYKIFYKDIELGKFRLIYITENADWSIRWDGITLKKYMELGGYNCTLDVFPRYYIKSIIHFGSLNTFARSGHKIADSSNSLIVTIFHGDYGINNTMDKYINILINKEYLLDRIVVSNTIMENRLIHWGIPREKIVKIPIGIDLNLFKNFEPLEKLNIRKELGIPKNTICIGSFQKDGEGWEEGNSPKWIKGPDIFISVVTELAKTNIIHCLLTGPARGYIKQKLTDASIPFTHKYLKNYFEIIKYYNCLDLYLITSREEGGPKAILESMATGVPVVSTKVGMAPDIIKDHHNGYIVDVDNVEEMKNCAGELINNNSIRSSIIQNGLKTVQKYKWETISLKHINLYNDIS